MKNGFYSVSNLGHRTFKEPFCNGLEPAGARRSPTAWLKRESNIRIDSHFASLTLLAYFAQLTLRFQYALAAQPDIRGLIMNELTAEMPNS
jgi:hypothetical protein